MRNGDTAVFWAAVRLALLLVCLKGATRFGESWGMPLVIFLVVFSLYNVWDLIALSTHAIFVSRFPAHPLRTVVLTLFTLVHLALVYSILYALMPNCFEPARTASLPQ